MAARMTPLAWMICASIVVWLGVTGLVGSGAHPEVLFGMLGPLVSAGVSWVLTERAYAAGPERVMGVMIKAFGAKVIFFGVYVVVMLRVLDLRPVPFVVSFTGYFIGLYALEAFFLRRLFMQDAGTGSRAQTS